MIERLLGLLVRVEPWGGVVELRRPAALVYVDRDLLRRWGWPEQAAWREGGRRHRAPVEVHWTLTRRCDRGCADCYTASTPDAPPFDRAQLDRVADALAAEGVFQVAIGGGEPLADPAILDVARALRRRGITPSATTRGGPVTPALARRLGDFGQVNVSLDAVDDTGFATADRALRLLRAARRRVGINAVLTRGSFAGLPDLVDYARRRRVDELELLRLKPLGRATRAYRERRLTPAQTEARLPTVLHAARRRRVRIKLDCSFAPFVYHHRPPPRVVRFFRIVGCEAGDSLASVDAAGARTGCSFLPEAGGLDRYAAWRDDAPAPCRACAYLSLCNGGCRAVAAYLTGEALSPDPECPRVRAERGSR